MKETNLAELVSPVASTRAGVLCLDVEGNEPFEGGSCLLGAMVLSGRWCDWLGEWAGLDCGCSTGKWSG